MRKLFQVATGLLALVMMLAPACNNPKAPTTSVVPTTTDTQPPASSSTTSTAAAKSPLDAPTPEELTAGHYTYPEFPRITAEKLHQMIYDANDTGRIFDPGTYVTYWDFVIVDVRNANAFKKPGRIAGAWNFPFSYYWVLDPREDPKPEEKESYQMELKALEANLPTLPKDKTVIFYDETADDKAACIVAQMLLDLKLGYDPGKVFVLNGGFYHYTIDDHPAFTFEGRQYMAAPGGYGWVFGDAEDFE